MIEFVKFNKNPKGRKTGDCSTRAISTLLNISWEEALKLQFEESIKTKYDITSRQVMEKVLNKFGFTKKSQPRKINRNKYKVNEMDEVLTSDEMEDGVIVNVAHHYVCIKDYCYLDTWDSGKKTVGNYYSKEVY